MIECAGCGALLKTNHCESCAADREELDETVASLRERLAKLEAALEFFSGDNPWELALELGSTWTSSGQSPRERLQNGVYAIEHDGTGSSIADALIALHERAGK